MLINNLFDILFCNMLYFLLLWIVCLAVSILILFRTYFCFFCSNNIMFLRYCCATLRNISFFYLAEQLSTPGSYLDLTQLYNIKIWYLSNLTNYSSTFDNNLFILSLLILCICYCCWQIYVFTLKSKYKDISTILQIEQRLLFYWVVQFCAFVSLFFSIWLSLRILTLLIFSEYLLLHVPLTALIVKFIVSLFVTSWWFMFLWSFKSKPISLFKTVYNIEAVILYFLAVFLLYKLIDCQDLLEFTLLFESSSLLFCILCALSSNSIASVSGSLKHVEAALKLYINTSVSSGFLLLGFGLIYGATGCYILSDINAVNLTAFSTLNISNFYGYDIRSFSVLHNLELNFFFDFMNMFNFNFINGNLISFVNSEKIAITNNLNFFLLSNFHSFSNIFVQHEPVFSTNRELFDYLNEDIMSFENHGSFWNFKPDLFLLGCLCFFVAFGLKLTIVPMHLWVAEIYEGSNVLFISFFGIIPKLVIWFLFAKFYIIYFNIHWILSFLFFCLGFWTSIYAALHSYKVLKIKDFLALSAILTSGYILMIIAYAGILNYFCIVLSLLYLTTYAIGMSSILTFIINQPAFIDYELKSNSKFSFLLDFLKTDLNLLSSWSGLYKVERLYAFILIIAIFTCLGIPPFSGFISKFFIFKITTGSYLGAYLSNVFLSLDLGQISFSILFLLVSLLSIILYLRLVKVVMFNYLSHHAFFSVRNPLIVWLQSIHALIMVFLFIGITFLSIFLHFIIY